MKREGKKSSAYLVTVYNATSSNETNMHELDDLSSHLQQESNITSHSQENITNPQESNYVSSILQEAMDISINEVENTSNTQAKNYHHTFSFHDMEEVSSNLLFF